MESFKEKISVIITVYKAEEFLDKCITSVLNQTYNNLEIILIDDFSPDRSGEICDYYGKLDNRIKVVHFEEDLGYNIGFLTGVTMATGEWIIFMDSDDWLDSKDAYERVFKRIDNEVDYVILDHFICEGNKKKYSKHFAREFIANNETDRLGILCSLYSSQYSPVNNYTREGEVWNKIYKSELVLRCMEDFKEFLPQIPPRTTCLYGAMLGFIHAQTIQYISDAVYCFRFHADTSTLCYQKNVREIWEKENYFTGIIAEKYNLNNKFYAAMNITNVRKIFQYACQYAFHPQNTMSFKNKKKDFEVFINAEPYKTALLEIDHSLLYKPEKYMFIGKRVSVTLVYVMVKLRELKHIIGTPKYWKNRKKSKSDWNTYG